MNWLRNKIVVRLGIVVAALAVMGGGYYLLRYQAWSAYRSWSIGRMNTMARDFIAADDPRSALLTVRKVLSSRPNDVEAWRLGVKAADLSSSSEAVVFQRNLCRVQKNTANSIELMRLALKYEAYGHGIEAITAVAAEASSSADYHRMAAEIYRQVNRNLPAKFHLLSLLSLEPDNNAARLALAEIEFEMAPKNLPADWAGRVKELVRVPEAELAATLLQLRAAVAQESGKTAAELANRLRARADLTVAQRLYLLEAAYLYDERGADELLARLQHQVADHPADVILVMKFLSKHAKPAAVQAWYPRLPESVRDDQKVKLATAEALMTVKSWPELESVLRGTAWKTDEHLRMLMLSYVYRMTGRTVDFSESWKITMIAAGQDPRKIYRLLQSVEKWQWESERYELVWRLFNLVPTNDEVRKFLVAREYQEGKTVNLNKIYARVMEANPRDDTARNNFAYTSLLLNTNSGRAQSIARELFKAHPENVAYRTTYSLALHKQGQSQEALGVMEQLDASTRQAPVPMVHEAAYAAASGQLERAGILLPALEKASLLPEQRELAVAARRIIARQETATGKQSKLLAMESGADSGTGGWLALLPARAGSATIDVKLSNSYYREGNFESLRELLRGARWQEDDFLRYALLAFVERAERRDNLVTEFWRQAVSAAGRDVGRLNDLRVLATSWQWADERMEVVARLFERESSDRQVLAELLDYYRQRSRTAEMARVLWLYVNQTTSSGTEAAWCVYYSLLCGLNESPAQTLASRIYDKSPAEAHHRVAYAFALWRQGRADEALKLIGNLNVLEAGGMQVSLLEGGILLDLGRKEDARKTLSRFTSVNAMPEEINLAETLFRQAGLPSALSSLTLQ